MVRKTTVSMATCLTYPPVRLLCLPENSNAHSSTMWPVYHRSGARLSDGLVIALWKPEDLTCDPKTLSLMERGSCRLSTSMLPLSGQDSTRLLKRKKDKGHILTPEWFLLFEWLLLKFACLINLFPHFACKQTQTFMRWTPLKIIFFTGK